jgi:hypothetical protein
MMSETAVHDLAKMVGDRAATERERETEKEKENQHPGFCGPENE